jgi:hypothetical protein
MRIAAFALAVLLLLAPQVGHACAVCFSGREDARAAFLVTTILLTLLPLGMIGALVLWLRQRVRAAAREAREAEPASEVGSAPDAAATR